MSYAYLDMIILFYTNNKMHDVHLLNFPIFEKYESEVLFEECEDWKYTITGITRDVEKKMKDVLMVFINNIYY